MGLVSVGKTHPPSPLGLVYVGEIHPPPLGLVSVGEARPLSFGIGVTRGDAPSPLVSFGGLAGLAGRGLPAGDGTGMHTQFSDVISWTAA